MSRIQDLIDRQANGEVLQFAFFYGKESDYPCFSQFHECTIVDNDTTYRTAEQYMMAAKARYFNDDVSHTKIMRSLSPSHAKALGRAVEGYVDAEWDAVRYDIVLAGNILKFTQNEDLKNILLATGDKIIVEASPTDDIWGIALDEDVDADIIQDVSKWKGQNLLGFVLMDVRDYIRSL